MTRIEAFLTLTNTDPMTRLPLEKADRAQQTLAYAHATGLATGRGYLGRTYQVTCRAGEYAVTSKP
jgi:hypothetical protein